jgi:hypothetical protein
VKLDLILRIGVEFMPQHCASHPDVVVRPLIEPEIWREISLITVRGRQHSAAVGALVSEARRWFRRGHHSKTGCV